MGDLVEAASRFKAQFGEAARQAAPIDGNGEGPHDSTMTDVTQGLVDAKIEAAEARTDAKFERVLSEMRVGFAEMRATSISKGTLFATAITLFFGIVGVVGAMLAFGSQWFGLGLDTSAVARQAATEALAAYTAQRAPAPTK